jgi:membrane-associated phospholipid phosphatase
MRLGKDMSTSDSAAPRSLSPAGFAALPPRIVTNLVRWIAVLVRKPRTHPPRWPVGAWVALALTAAAVVAAMFVVDLRASEWARNLPRSLIDGADEITNFGLSGWFLYPLGFVILCLAGVLRPALQPTTQGLIGALAARFGFLFIAIGLPGLFDTIIKRMIGRARPYVGGHDDPFAYKLFIWRPEYASMPSGHATTATAAAIAIGAIWPRSRAVMWLYALTIMLTRVVINVHHPSDVIAGALVGVVGALMVRRYFAARGLVFEAGTLDAYPWPSWKRIKAAARDISGVAAKAT